MKNQVDTPSILTYQNNSKNRWICAFQNNWYSSAKSTTLTHLSTPLSIPRVTSQTTQLFLLSWFKNESDEKNRIEDANKYPIQDNQQQQKQQQVNQNGNMNGYASSSGTVSVGKTASMMEKFKKSQEVNIRTKSLIEELSSTIITGTSANTRVKVFVDGQLRPVGLEIDETLKGEDLTASVLEAMQDAHDKFELNMGDKIKVLYSNLGL